MPRSSRARRRGGRSPRRADPITVEIAELAPTGEGVAKVDGRALFVPRTVPGELVLVAPEGDGRVRRAKLLSVVRAAESRIEPGCAVAERCGGCDWMHIASEQAAEHKARALAAALGRVVDDLPEPRLHRPSPPLAYRERARLAARRTRDGMQVGYRAARSRQIVDVGRCPVLVPELDAVLEPASALLDGSEGQGEIQLALGEGRRPVAEVRWTGELGPGVVSRASELVDNGTFAGIRLWPEGTTKPLDYGDPRPALELDGDVLRLAPGGFGQASAAGGRALGQQVAAILREAGGTERVVELFAGAGTLTVEVAPLCARYEAVEQVEEAAEALRANLRSRGVEAKVTAGDANERPISKATRAVVLDPPRAGAPGAVARIVEARPHHVVYVSCNPQTLARDLGPLVEAGYRVRHVHAFDLFPQTSHVEAIVHLDRQR